MKSVTISTFTMQVRDTQGGDTYRELRHLPPGHDLLILLADYLHQLELSPANDKINQVLLKATRIKKQGRSISGVLSRGEYGLNSDLLDIKKSAVMYSRSVDDAEMMPFYFLAVIPLSGTRALIAFELEGNSGIKMQFQDGFETFLKQRCQYCDLEIERLVPGGLLNHYLKTSRVTKLRLVPRKVPKDIAQAIRMGIGSADATMEIQVRVKRGETFANAERVQGLLQGDLDPRNFVQIKDFDFDTVKVEFDVGGKRRTLDLAARDSFRADYNITAKVEMHGGHPSFPSVDAAAREIVREIMRSLNLEAKGV